jgi:hypothetical protein
MPMSPRTLRPRNALHPEAASWAARVVANGGAVGTSLPAVDRFCRAIDAAGIRDRFVRLNLFCGGPSGTVAGLNACIVPLYRNTSPSGSPLGNATDTNFGPFLPENYNETGASGGLVGNASTKYLRTGVLHNTLPQNDSHIASYEISRASTTFRTSVGCRATSTTGNLILGTWASTSQYALVGYESNASLTLANSGGGFYVGTIAGASASALYRNGAGKVTTATTTRTPGAQEIYVFALNDGGSVNVPTDARLGGYSFGLQMSDDQVLAYSTAMQAFQTALTRNV